MITDRKDALEQSEGARGITPRSWRLIRTDPTWLVLTANAPRLRSSSRGMRVLFRANRLSFTTTWKSCDSSVATRAFLCRLWLRVHSSSSNESS